MSTRVGFTEPANTLQRPKIALMLPKFSLYGGAEQFGYRLSTALVEKGYDVDFLCARQEVAAPAGVKVIRVGRIGGTRFLKTLWFLWRVEVLRKKGNYDLSISLGKNLNQDMIRMGGGPLRIYWEKSEKALEKGVLRLYKRFTRMLSPVNWLILAVEKRQFRSGCHIVAVSHLVRDWLLKAHPNISREQVSVVYNQPDLSRFFILSSKENKVKAQGVFWKQYCAKVREQEPFSDSETTPIFIGTASTNFILKGVAPLIRSLVYLPKNVHLFVAGGRNAGEYVGLAEKLGVSERVHFCGKVSDMPTFYHALDVFVLPTFYDACSNAVLEALASGCHVISSADNGASFFLPAQSVLGNPGDGKAIAVSVLSHLSNKPDASFAWPTGVPSGIHSFVDEVERVLGKQPAQQP